MTDIDLTGDIQIAIDGAGAAGKAVVLAYIDADGAPSMSYRGSAQVRGREQIVLWSRQKEGGLIAGIAERPIVSLLYHSRSTPGASHLFIRGRARVAPELDDLVYNGMAEGERERDPERSGVAIVIDVDSVRGEASGGAPIRQRRD